MAGWLASRQNLVEANQPSTSHTSMTVTTDTEEGTLLLEDRRRQIRELIAEKGSATTEELATRFRTSLVTIRGDLKSLADSGALVRTHGGAVALRDTEDLPIGIKETLHLREKIRIAAAAAAMIRDGETIILDSGSTTAEIAKRIRTMPLQSINVITNALNIAVILANASHVRLVILGGVLRANSYSLSGPLAESALKSLHADKLFLGVDSLDPDVGVMTPDLYEAQLNAQMIRCAGEVIAVGDASKLAKRNLSVIAKIEEIHKLVTDSSANPQVVQMLRARGLDVVLV